ncbi:MAG: CoB--CoM heterodisulfide reductase iron-sulfur subunit A family protein, partial [Desulfovibrionaceae bacterium]|nr:CoB--CoM heterodisulfide reductase iron-sulfur subunit A family protein [Desulfovibrionaceae bacterium]
MAEKIGVYICGGCDIAAAVNIEGIAASVKNKYGGNCPVIKTDAVLCSPESVARIKADVKENALDAVCLCACSPRVKWDVFAFDVLTERVNIREFCVWSFDKQTSAPDAAKGIDNLTIMAQEYTLMGVVKLTKSSVPDPETLTTNKTILVLGGGFTGLTAALEAAAVGHEVVLVERKAELGGRALGMYKSIPLAPPYTETQDTGIDKLVAAVRGNAKIKALTSSELKSLGGAPGLYTAQIETGGAAHDYAIGAVIVATGWEPQAAEFLAPMGYGSIRNVVTAAEFEAMAKKGAIARPSDGKMPASVAFVLDVGMCLATPEAPREDACANPAEPAEGAEAGPAPYPNTESCKHLAYSSELTSLVALKQAGYLREKNENGLAMIVYDHMMVPGLNERYYKAAQDDPGVMLTKGTVAGLTETANGQIVVNCRDSLLGENIELLCDMVVLPTGMVPTTAHEPTVNLVYRQGPQFPDLGLFDGFADSNYICFPYETRRTGVYAAGCVHQPMTMAQAADDAAGAALKAVQCISSINRGVAVHPRSGDKSYPVFNFVRCTQCKRCT